MHFSRFDLSRANLSELEGIILAHDLKCHSLRLKKGQQLTLEQLTAIKASGLTHLYGACMEAEDINEDLAAEQLANALTSDTISSRKAQGGRYSLVANTDGLLDIDTSLVNQLNLQGGEITLATLKTHAVVKRGQIVATVKVIPFSINQRKLEQAIALVKIQPLIKVLPFQIKRAGLIQTYGQQANSKQLQRSQDVTEQRLNRLGCELAFDSRCSHNLTQVKAQIQSALDHGCQLLLILGTSMTVDQQDIIPQAIIELGGEITHFGMPVQPGNMLLLAKVNQVTIINMPGCSRSLAANGFDLVLEREIAAIKVSSEDILSLGVGGLLVSEDKLLPAEPFEMQTPSHVAAIILAAGRSTRMGENNKLLADVAGQPMLHWAIDSAQQANVKDIIVVSGHQADEVGQVAKDHQVTLVHNQEFTSGIASSIKAGLQALDDNVDALFIMLGDMPFVASEQLNAMINSFNNSDEQAIVLPYFRQQRGNPVLWSKRYITELMQLSGDIGARHLLKKYAEHIVEIEFSDDAVIIDIDTPQVLANYKDSTKVKQE
jgi:molybdenum cofactor cytidylyltransferase